MVFSSLEFLLIFLPATLAVVSLAMRTGERATIWTLLIASLIYYSWWNWTSLFVLIPLTALTYVTGSRLARSPSNAVAAFVITANLATLAYFKYAAFFSGIARSVFPALPALPEQVLPLGISFFVFQKIAFIMDVRAGRARPDDWPRFLLFVSFFPQLIAGPIVHWRELAPQLRLAVMLPQRNLELGLTLFAIGLAKKTLIADLLSPYVAAGFGNAASLTQSDAWLAVTAYTLQIYFDFSGYSDMALGLALMFGIRLPWNFLSPYKAGSIVEFWRRWHITLSHFLRDYLYVPLGGNRKGEPRRYANIMITMLLGGLWHGAGWTFIAWGGLHGVFIISEHAWHRTGLRMPPLPAHALTLLAVMAAWVMFRAPDFDAAIAIYAAMLAGAPGASSAMASAGGPLTYTVLAVGALIALFAPNAKEISERIRLTAPVAACVGLIGAAALLKQLYAGEISEFIYFRF